MNANVLNNNKVAQIFGDSKYLYTLSLSLSHKESYGHLFPCGARLGAARGIGGSHSPAGARGANKPYKPNKSYKTYRAYRPYKPIRIPAADMANGFGASALPCNAKTIINIIINL